MGLVPLLELTLQFFFENNYFIEFISLLDPTSILPPFLNAAGNDLIDKIYIGAVAGVIISGILLGILDAMDEANRLAKEEAKAKNKEETGKSKDVKSR